MSSRWKGVVADDVPAGSEVFVELTQNGMTGSVVEAAVAFRTQRHHTWSPPIALERAP